MRTVAAVDMSFELRFFTQGVKIDASFKTPNFIQKL
jgi:hypothetical protein